MVLIRCREYDDDRNPRKPGGCPKGRSCDFVHPDNPFWPRAARRDPTPRKQHAFPSNRGLGRGRGGPPNRSRDRTGSNTTPVGGASGSNIGSDSGWGSKVGGKSGGAWGAGWGGAGAGNDEGSSTGFWSTGWGSTDDSKKGADGGVKDNHKGKGKATESAWGWADADTEGGGSSVTGWATNDGWGKVEGWGSSETNNPTTSWNASEQKDEQGSPKLSTASPFTEKQPSSEAGVSDKDEWRKRLDRLDIPPSAASTKMTADSPQTSAQPASATSWRDVKPFASPIINTGPSSVLNRQVTPDVSGPSSRSGSVIPANPPPTKTRSLRNVSYKEAKRVWGEYIEHIRRAIMLRLLLLEERAHIKAYKTAQSSPTYMKVGRRGTVLLDDSMRTLRSRLDRKERAYKLAIDRLCVFEEGFDFVVHALTGRDIDPTKMKDELSSMREFIEEARTCIDGMQTSAGDFETKTKVINPPTTNATKATEVKKEKPESSILRTREQEFADRLKDLEEKATDLFNALQDSRGVSNADVAVKGKVHEMRTDLEGTLGAEEEEFFERIGKIGEDHASLGRDMDELCNEMAGMFVSVKQAELSAEQEITQLQAALDEDRRILEVSEANTKECRNLLDKSNENLSFLRRELHAFEESKEQRSPAPSQSNPEELLSQLVVALLPVIRTKLYPDIDSALDCMTSGVEADVRDQSKKQVQALRATLAPVYALATEVYGEIDSKKLHSLVTGPRPVSTHAGPEG